MKKIGVLFGVLLAVIAIVAIGFAAIGCSSAGGGKTAALERYVVDLSLLEAKKNPTAFTKIYDVWEVPFPEFPVDIKQFKNVTMTAKAFDTAGRDITGWQANAQVKLVVDFNQPYDATGPNVLFHELNVGFDGLGPLTTNGGSLTLFGSLETLPQGFIIQNSNADIAYIEITSLIFHNGMAIPPVTEAAAGAGILQPFDLELKGNFQYGKGYQGLLRDPQMLGGVRLMRGDVYNLKATYTASRDLEQDLRWGFTNPNPWMPISYSQPNGDDPPQIVVPASKAGEEVSVDLTFTMERAGGSGVSGNSMVIEIVPGDRAAGPVTLSFSKFELTKL